LASSPWDYAAAKTRGVRSTVVALAALLRSPRFHLSLADVENTELWAWELVGHHASIPLALVILYQDYRFALVDIVLRRALSLVALVAITSGLYVGIGAPLLERVAQSPDVGVMQPAAIIGPVDRRRAHLPLGPAAHRAIRGSRAAPTGGTIPCCAAISPNDSARPTRRRPS